MRKEEFISYNQAQTEDIGARLAQALTGGEVLALYGGLGAGKTAFTRGLARGLGIARPVTSPTFTLLHQYRGRLALNHFDVYRLSSAEEAEDIGIDEIMEADGVTAVSYTHLDVYKRQVQAPGVPYVFLAEHALRITGGNQIL